MCLYNNKTIVLGGSGFLGKNFVKLLDIKNRDFVSTSSKDINLINPKNEIKLKELNECKNCSLIFFSALTPDKGKDIDTYNLNIKMAENFLKIFEDNFNKNNHIIYISSDSVYPLSIENIQSDTLPSPTDLYSSMHLTREIMFKDKFKENLTIIRPTLIYGHGDTHNSYGPNRFFKQIIEKNEINIFGEGLDMRDHLYITDFCNILYEILLKKMYGTFNFATGFSISYIDLANMFKKLLPEINIKKIPVNNKKTQRFFDLNDFLNNIGYSVSSLERNLFEYKKLLDIK